MDIGYVIFAKFRESRTFPDHHFTVHFTRAQRKMDTVKFLSKNKEDIISIEKILDVDCARDYISPRISQKYEEIVEIHKDEENYNMRKILIELRDLVAQVCSEFNKKFQTFFDS